MENTILIIIVSTITTMVIKFIEILFNKKITTKDKENELEFLREKEFYKSYYPEANKALYDIYSDQINYLQFNETCSKDDISKHVVNLKMTVFKFGSPKSMKIFSAYNIYANSDNESKSKIAGKNNESDFILILISKLTQSIRYDYSGIEMEKLQILKMHLNDYVEKHKQIEELNEKADKFIEEIDNL